MKIFSVSNFGKEIGNYCLKKLNVMKFQTPFVSDKYLATCDKGCWKSPLIAVPRWPRSV